MPFKETDCMKCAWKPDDDNVFELVRKALDEQSYEHHWQILAYLAERFKLARLGAAVEAMPFNSALRHLPMNDSSDEKLKFPVGVFPWVFERPGESSIECADPLSALTWTHGLEGLAPPPTDKEVD